MCILDFVVILKYNIQCKNHLSRFIFQKVSVCVFVFIFMSYCSEHHVYLKLLYDQIELSEAQFHGQVCISMLAFFFCHLFLHCRADTC